MSKLLELGRRAASFSRRPMILFAPRTPAEERALRGKVEQLLSLKDPPSYFHVSDLVEAPQAVFRGVQILTNSGVNPRQIIPHLSAAADMARLESREGDSLELFAKLGINRFMFLHGVQRGSSSTRQKVDDRYDEVMLDELRDIGRRAGQGFDFRFSFYPAGHAMTHRRTHHASLDPSQILRQEKDNLVRKIEVLAQATGRDDALEAVVCQHGFGNEFNVAHEELKDLFDGMPIQIIPSILPVGPNSKLLRAFSVNRNATLSPKAEEICERLAVASKSGDAKEKDRIMREEGIPATVEIYENIVRNSDVEEVIFYLGDLGLEEVKEIFRRCDDIDRTLCERDDEAAGYIEVVDDEPTPLASHVEAKALKAERGQVIS